MRSIASIGPATTVACAIALGGSLVATTAFAQQSGNGQTPGTTPYTTTPPPTAPVFTAAPLPSAPPPSTLPSPSLGAQPGYRPPGPTPMAPGAPRETPIGRDQAGKSQVPDLNTAVAGGITADQVGQRAALTSYQARAAEETASSAGARAEGAWTNFVPRVGLKASYTRLSNFTPPSIGSGSIIVSPAPPGTQNPSPLIASSFSFPLVLNNWLTTATIAVPISDYFLRINENYTATLKQEEAARWDVATARAKSFSDGKIAYYTWLRARSSLVVAEQSLTVAKAHQKDAENQFAVGNASKADVLRAQTQGAAADLGVERGRNAVIVAERQVRLAVHAKEDEKLEPGETLESPVNAPPKDLKSLVAEAMTNRPELKSLDRNAEAARRLANVQKAGMYPSVSGFGDVTYADPNQRRFPQTNEWFPTWSAGAQITWSPNDYLLAGPNTNDAIARANAIDAQKMTTKDGIELEVVQAYQSVLEADVSMETTTRQLESAEEAYRVARELFNAGRGTSTTLIDAETSLAQSRFEHLNAKVDARLARIRLEHALGHDVGK